MSTTYIFILGDSEISLWGLSGRERLQRIVASLKQVCLIDNPAAIPADAPALLLRADHLYDARVITALVQLQEEMLLMSQTAIPVALRSTGKNIPSLLESMRNANISALSGIQQYTLQDLQVGIQQTLKKKESPFVLPINATQRKALEWE